MKLGKWFAEHYDVLVMEDIQVKQLVGKSFRRLRMRLHDVAIHELRSVMEYQQGDSFREPCFHFNDLC